MRWGGNYSAKEMVSAILARRLPSGEIIHRPIHVQAFRNRLAATLVPLPRRGLATGSKPWRFHSDDREEAFVASARN
jgi:hypothetical protein